MTATEYRPSIAFLLREGARSTFSDRGGLLSYGMLATLALMAVWCLAELSVLGDPDTANIAAESALVLVAFCWHRRYFIGPERDKDIWIPWRGADEWQQISGFNFAYTLRALLLFGTLAAAAVAVAFVVYHGFLEAAHEDAAILILTIPVYSILFVATARFLLVFPAYASGRRMSWLQSWTLCRGLGLRLGVAILLTWLPMVAFVAASFFLPVSVQESIVGDIVITFLIAGSRVLGLLVALNVTACLYKRLSEPAGVSAFD